MFIIRKASNKLRHSQKGIINLFSMQTILFLSIYSLVFFISCSSTSITEQDTQTEIEVEVYKESENTFADGTEILTSQTEFLNEDTILLTFAGDLMAHKPNWNKGHFDKIYQDIVPLLKESNAAFANLSVFP